SLSFRKLLAGFRGLLLNGSCLSIGGYRRLEISLREFDGLRNETTLGTRAVDLHDETGHEHGHIKGLVSAKEPFPLGPYLGGVCQHHDRIGPRQVSKGERLALTRENDSFDLEFLAVHDHPLLSGRELTVSSVWKRQPD